MMLGLTTIVGRTRQKRRTSSSSLKPLIDPLVGLSLLYRSFGDLSQHPLDGPVPEPVVTESSLRSSAYLYYDLAQKNGLSIRQLYKKIEWRRSTRPSRVRLRMLSMKWRPGFIARLPMALT